MVSLEDWKSAATFLAEHDVPSGAVQRVLPHARPRTVEFVEALAQQLHRPAPFVVPTKLLELAMGGSPPSSPTRPTSVPRRCCVRASPSSDDDVADVVATALAAR